MGNWPYTAHFLARSGCLGQRPDKAEIIFWLKQFLLTSASIPDGVMVPACAGPQDPPAASRLLKASANFFLFQTVPLDLSVNP